MNPIPFSLKVDAITIRGQYFSDPARKTPKPCIIILHGIPRDKSFDRDACYPELARRMARLGWLAVIFNFRGAGESGGNFHIKGWDRDLRAVVGYFAQRPECDSRRIAVMGFSGGAATAIYTAAACPKITAVVALSSPAEFNFAEGGVNEWIARFRAIGLIRDPAFPPSVQEWEQEFQEIKPLLWIHKIGPRPLLIVHGNRDDVVPVEHARQLFEKANDPKELYILSAGHRLKHEPEALDYCIRWLENWKNSVN